MFSWKGSAGICMNDKEELLMVLQAAPGEEKKWTIPSGTLEDGENFKECCAREFFEETGYTVKVGELYHTKQSILSDYGISVYVEYFLVEILGGDIALQDPDGFIHEIKWKSWDEIKELPLAYPDDLQIIEQVIMGVSKKR